MTIKGLLIVKEEVIEEDEEVIDEEVRASHWGEHRWVQDH